MFIICDICNRVVVRVYNPIWFPVIRSLCMWIGVWLDLLVILLIYLDEWNKIYNEPCFLSGHVLFLSWFVRYSSSISWRSLRLQLDLRSAGEWQIFISFLQLACVRGQNEGAGVISLDWKCCGGCARHRWTLRAWTVCSNCVSMFLCVCIAHLAVTLKLNVETTWWTDPDLLAIDWHNPTN